jgi:hypothetical protein
MKHLVNSDYDMVFSMLSTPFSLRSMSRLCNQTRQAVDNQSNIGMICFAKLGLIEDLYILYCKRKNFQYHAICVICALDKGQAYS